MEGRGDTTAWPGPKWPGDTAGSRDGGRPGSSVRLEGDWYPSGTHLPQVGSARGAMPGCACSPPGPARLPVPPEPGAAPLHPQGLLLCQGLSPQPSQPRCRRCNEKNTPFPRKKSIGRPRGSPNWMLLTERPLQ